MKLRDLLTESPSAIVYHFTSFASAQKILKDNAFALSPFMAKGIESDIIDTKKTFYLSTTRSKLGRYGQNNFKMLAFVLDGNKLAANHSSKPIDYWNDRGSEMEDRILSDNPYIKNANKFIRGIEIFVRPEDMEESLGQIKAIIIEAEGSNIPVRIYDNVQNFNASRNPIDIRDKVLSAEDWEPYQSSYNIGSYIKRYTNALKGENLDSPEMEKFIYNIRYYPQDLSGQLKADAHNANSTDEMREFALVARKLKLKTLDDVVNYLKKKYPTR